MLGLLKKIFSGGPSVDFEALIDNGAIILDVRTKAEFQQGHVKGAVNVPLDQVDKKVKKLKSRNKPVITCCASGRRSGIAASRLTSQGIEAYNGGPWTRVNRYV
jgi:phage shock protein E